MRILVLVVLLILSATGVTSAQGLPALDAENFEPGFQPIPALDANGNQITRDQIIEILRTAPTSTLKAGIVEKPEVGQVETTLKSGSSCPTSKKELTGGYDIFYRSVSKSAAAALEYFATAEIGVNDRVVLAYLAWYKNITDSDGYVVATCGSGIQLAIKYTDIDGSISASLGNLAAKGQLENKSVQIRARTFGLSGPEIDKTTPKLTAIGTGDFDVNGYSELLSAIDKVSEAAIADQQRDSSTPAQVVWTPEIFLAGGASEFDYTPSLIQARALRFISEGQTCRVAQRQMPKKSSTSNKIVRSVYENIANKCSKSQAPDNIAQARAQKILDSYLDFSVN